MAIVVSIVGKYDGRDIAKAQAELDRMGKQAGVAGGEMGTFGKTIAAVGGAMAAAFTVTKVVDFLKDSANAAMEDEKAMRSLATAMENTGNAASIPEVEAGIDRLSRMAGVADDVLRPAFQTLVTSSGNVEQSQKALALALDISTATGRDLNTVSLALAKGYAGQTQGLSRLGAGLDKATLKTGDMDLITAALSKKFEGQAAAAADTYAGKMAKISVASGEASETIGYALLGALDNASNSFGGTDGITARIDAFAASAADTITTIGGLVGMISTLSSSIDNLSSKFSFASQNGDFLRDSLINMVPGGQQLIDIFKTLGMVGDLWNGTQKQVSDVAPSATNQYVRMGMAAGVTAASIGELTTETDAASDAQKRLAAAFGILDGAISRRQAINDLAVAIREISKAADDGNVSLKGNSDAVIANQDVVIDAVKKAEAAAKAMGGTADEQAVNFGNGIARIRQSLVDNGFKPKDVDAFLKELRTADTKAALLLEGLGSGRAADAARYSAMALGNNITLGLIAGMNAGAAAVAGAGAKTVRELEAGANAAGEIQSPSQLFVRVGQNIVDGLVLGVAGGSDKVAAAGASLIGSMSLQFDGAIVTMRGKGVELGGALADGYQTRLDGFKGIVDTQVGIIQRGRDALKAYADSITSTIMGNVKFDTQNADGSAMTPEQIVASVFGSIENQNAAVAAVAANIGAKLPGDLLNMILTMPPDAAIGVANYLGSNPALLEQLAWNYKGLGKFTNNALGIPMGEAWAMVGDESAVSMIAKAKETIATEAASFRAWVRSHLATTITVKVEYDTSGKPSGTEGKALGGPVVGGTPYIVGENGPELFVPGKSGTIVPNDVLAGSASRGSGGGGNTYAINVQAGVGDPRQIGQQVVEYIKRFEASNSASWRAA